MIKPYTGATWVSGFDSGLVEAERKPPTLKSGAYAEVL